MQSDSLVRLCGFILTFNLAISAVAGQPASQVLAPTDANRYEAFFKQVARLKTISENSTTVKRRDGRSYRIVVPKIQDVIGLADREVDAITATAKQCVSELQRLLVAHQFVFEARLQELENGRVAEPEASQIRELQERKRDMILSHVQRLKDELGPRFNQLDDFVSSPTWERALMPSLEPAER